MIAKFSVKKPYTVLVGVVLVIVLGVVAFTRMTTDLLPNMNLPYALVITTDVGASPIEVEKDVTSKIEASMATTANIKNITSMSYNSYSLVVLEYEQSTNMDSIVIEMQQKLDQLKGTWSDSVGTPMIMQLDPGMLPIMVASADVEGMSQSEISSYVNNEIVPNIESVEGVASVTLVGALEENIQVTMNQDKIDALNEKIQKEIENQFVDAQSDLDDAKAEIENGQKELENGQSEFADQMSSSANEVINGKIQTSVTELDLTTKLASLKESKSSLESGISKLQGVYNTADKLSKSIAAMEQMEPYVSTMPDDLFLATAGMSKADFTTNLAAARSGLAQINAGLSAQAASFKDLGVTLNSYTDIPAAVGKMSEALAKVNSGISAIEDGQRQIAEGKASLNDAYIALNKAQIEGLLQMSAASAKLADASNALEQGQQQLDNAKETALDSADLNQVLSLDTLKNLLIAQNFSMPAGYVTQGDDQYLVNVGDEVSSMDELNDIVLIDLGMDHIEPIRLSDVAEVKMVDNAAESYSKVNGNPAVMLSIEKQTGYSTGDVTDRVLDKFAVLEKDNEELNLSVLMNQGIYIDIIVHSVIENMIVGAILAIIVLILFLKDFKPTLVIACSIPLSVIFAIVLMYFSKISLNIISLSGLALGIGMLVDNSIVVIENIYRLRKEGLSIKKASIEGTSQVSGAIIASTLTTVCVFAPIIFAQGITRQLFVDIALTIAFTLTASLLVALTFVPMMAAGILKNTKEMKTKFFDKIRDWYGRVLYHILRFKAVVFLLCIVLLAVSIYAAFSKGFSFMNMEMQTDQLTLTIEAKEDEMLSFEEICDISDEVTNRISDIEGIDTIGAMTGGGSVVSSLSQSGQDAVTMYLILDPDSKVSGEEILAQIDEETKDLNCKITSSASASEFSSFFGEGITVEIKGNDLDKLQEIAKEVGEIVENTEGTMEVNNGLDDTTAQLKISVDKEKAAQYRLTVAQVFQIVYAKMASNTASTSVSTDLKSYDVFVQSEEQSDISLNDIKKLSFEYTNKDGEVENIPLTKIATFEEGDSLNMISRDAQTRYISVTAKIDDEHNVSLVSNEIQKELNQLELPEGYTTEMTGEDEMISDAMNQLYLMLILAVIFIYLIMVAQFQSLLSPFIIMFTIPLAFTGGFLALFLTGNEVSVVAMVGFVMLAGIIVNNGIVLVDYINQLRREGMAKKEAIVEAARTRLRPILMTALTTILAMLTMALGFGDGSEMMQPLAIVTEGGLIYGTLLTLVVVPCIYDAFNRNKSMVEEEL